MYLRSAKWLGLILSFARPWKFLFRVAHRQGEGQGSRWASLWETVHGHDLDWFALVRAEDVGHGEPEPLANWCQEVG